MNPTSEGRIWNYYGNRNPYNGNPMPSLGMLNLCNKNTWYLILQKITWTLISLQSIPLKYEGGQSGLKVKLECIGNCRGENAWCEMEVGARKSFRLHHIFIKNSTYYSHSYQVSRFGHNHYVFSTKIRNYGLINIIQIIVCTGTCSDRRDPGKLYEILSLFF